MAKEEGSGGLSFAVKPILKEAKKLASVGGGVGEGGQGAVVIDVAGGLGDGVGRVDKAHGPGFEFGLVDGAAGQGTSGGVTRVFEDGGEDAVDGLLGPFKDLEEGTVVVEEHAGDVVHGVAHAGLGEERFEVGGGEGPGRGTGVDELNHGGKAPEREWD